MDIKQMKKELQKIVKAHRDSKPKWKNYCTGELCTPEFPKAMLTKVQEQKQTATINFGRRSEARRAELAGFMESAALNDFCWKYGLTIVGMELNHANYLQIRLKW